MVDSLSICIPGTNGNQTDTFQANYPPVVSSINLAGTSPTNAASVSWTVTFNESVTGVDATDFSLVNGGLGGSPSITSVTGSGSGPYTVTASTGTGSGTLGLNLVDNDSIVAGVGNPLGGTGASNGNFTGQVYTIDKTSPTVTINQAAGQADPTNAQPINFTAVFNEAINGATFTGVDVALSGTAGNLAGATKVITLVSGNTYTVAISGLTTDGTVIASIPAGGVQDLVGNTNSASTSTDNTVTFDTTGPTVTINQAAGQADPTSAQPINFTAVFNEAINAGTFTGVDVALSGTAGNLAGATKIITLVSGNTYNVAISGLTTDGTVIATISAGGVQDLAGNTNSASTSTDNTVTRDTVAPTVTIDQATGQADPTNTQPINFTAVFSKAINASTFTGADVALTGTAGNLAGATKTITLVSGNTYNVAVSGLTTDGTVIATISAGLVQDLAGNTNTASTSTDNTVTRDATKPDVTINQAAGQADPTNTQPINFTAVFNEPINAGTFAGVDVALSGTAGNLAGDQGHHLGQRQYLQHRHQRADDRRNGDRDDPSGRRAGSGRQHQHRLEQLRQHGDAGRDATATA